MRLLGFVSMNNIIVWSTQINLKFIKEICQLKVGAQICCKKQTHKFIYMVKLLQN